MKVQAIPSTNECPARRQAVGVDAKAAFESLVLFCETCDEPLWIFEKQLLIVEGAGRYLVGECLDCAGMRWIQGKAEALLHLRCIELNGDWQKFASWFQRGIQARLNKDGRRKILTDQPLPLTSAP